MGDEQDRPLVLPKRLLEQATSVQVQVRRRFVQQEEVRCRQEETQERQTDLLAARQHACRFLDVILVEAEGAQLVAEVLLRSATMRVPRVLGSAVDADIRRNRLGEFLREVAGDHVVSEDRLALRRLTRARDDAHQRRLAEAVVTDERNLVAARDLEAEAVEDLLDAVIREAEIFAAEHLNARSRRFRQAQTSRLRVALRQHDTLLIDLVDELLTALGLRGLRRLRAETIHEPLQLLAMVILVLLRGEQMLITDLALIQIVIEIALVARRRARIHLDDDVRQRAQKIAVVGDEHQRAVIRLQELLQPVDGRQVQVVRRFVQQQEVGL